MFLEAGEGVLLEQGIFRPRFLWRNKKRQALQLLVDLLTPVHARRKLLEVELGTLGGRAERSIRTVDVLLFREPADDLLPLQTFPSNTVFFRGVSIEEILHRLLRRKVIVHLGPAHPFCQKIQDLIVRFALSRRFDRLLLQADVRREERGSAGEVIDLEPMRRGQDDVRIRGGVGHADVSRHHKLHLVEHLDKRLAVDNVIERVAVVYVNAFHNELRAVVHPRFKCLQQLMRQNTGRIGALPMINNRIVDVRHLPDRPEAS